MDNDFEKFFETPSVAEADAEDTTNVEAETETVEAETTADTEAETPVVEPEAKADERQGTMVPLAALKDERQKARDHAAEIDALRAELDRLKAPAPQHVEAASEPHIPDPYDDPTAYNQYVQGQVREQFALQNLVASRNRAEARYGRAVIEEVADWASQASQIDPTFEGRLLAQADPAEWVIAEKKRQELLKNFESDPDAFVRARALELGLATVAEPAAAVTQPATKSTGPSLTNVKSHNEVDVKKQAADAFDAIFKK